MDHFVYLTGCEPEGFTCDNFRDVRKLELDPYFREYLSNAFAPLGVHINFWRPTLNAASKHTFQVMMINDDVKQSSGELLLEIEDDSGHAIAKQTRTFEIPPLGQMTYPIDFDVPQQTGNFVLKAVAQPSAGQNNAPTVSRRWVELVPNQTEPKRN